MQVNQRGDYFLLDKSGVNNHLTDLVICIFFLSRRYMRGITVIDNSWLANIAKDSPLLWTSTPLDSPAPMYDPLTDSMTCFVNVRYGKQGWELPLHRVRIKIKSCELGKGGEKGEKKFFKTVITMKNVFFFYAGEKCNNPSLNDKRYHCLRRWILYFHLFELYWMDKSFLCLETCIQYWISSHQLYSNQQKIKRYS